MQPGEQQNSYNEYVYLNLEGISTLRFPVSYSKNDGDESIGKVLVKV